MDFSAIFFAFINSVICVMSINCYYSHLKDEENWGLMNLAGNRALISTPSLDFWCHIIRLTRGGLRSASPEIWVPQRDMAQQIMRWLCRARSQVPCHSLPPAATCTPTHRASMHGWADPGQEHWSSVLGRCLLIQLQKIWSYVYGSRVGELLVVYDLILDDGESFVCNGYLF